LLCNANKKPLPRGQWFFVYLEAKLPKITLTERGNSYSQLQENSYPICLHIKYNYAMEFFNLLLIFAVGTFVGSFLNVVSFRFNSMSVFKGRSMCLSCSRTLLWYELVPVGSFLFFGGKCRTCKSLISWQYPVVELMTGTLLLSLYLQGLKPLAVIYYFVIFSLLIVILAYDIRHKIIPDTLAYSFALLAFFALFINFEGLTLMVPNIGGLLAGPALAAPLAFLWLVSGGRWIGLGDAKLALGVGWLLGIIYGLSALVLAFWIGALFSLLALGLQKLRTGESFGLLEKHLTMKSEIPFAPFIIIGTAIVYFFSIDILGLVTFLEYFL
jgi:prepilin signal peptidase PulO-like enzyme (type II secretory pathway)